MDMSVAGRLAVAVGAALVGLGTLGAAFAGGLPMWHDTTEAAYYIPSLAGPVQATVRYLLGTAGLLLMSGLALRSGGGLSRWGIALWALALAVGLLSVPEPLRESLLTWVPAAALGGAVVFALAHLGATLPVVVPGIVATVLCADLLVQAVTGPYPGARPGAVAGVIVVGTLASAWVREIRSVSPRGTLATQ